VDAGCPQLVASKNAFQAPGGEMLSFFPEPDAFGDRVLRHNTTQLIGIGNTSNTKRQASPQYCPTLLKDEEL